MNKTLATLIFLFLLLAGVGFLFSRWWHSRTSKLTLSQAEVTPTPVPTTSSLNQLLSHMRPLADDEKTLELKPLSEDVSGLVRYLSVGNKLSFTAFILLTQERQGNLFLWVMTNQKTQNLGKFENAKGGLLVFGEIDKSSLPIVFVVAPEVNLAPGKWLLSGNLP